MTRTMTQQALKRLIQAAQRRDTIMGDVSSLLAAKAELAAAAKAAETAIAETEIWVPIPYKPGNPQPRIKDGVYRGIRIDGKGGFEGGFEFFVGELVGHGDLLVGAG